MDTDDQSINFDLMCLRALKVNGESERIALAAASIVVHAHAIAREVPAQAGEARRIIELARMLYATMPLRRTVAEMVDECLSEFTSGPTDRRRAAAARERLVDRIWHLFHHGSITTA
ncbi:hypothetical protein [Lichenibacterium dinghuense]|uniref:hypothetical protein n=1 Tax=Lichenibacterium dinghuense TaxID=2895977 RepID=UPI001F3B7250|nr:hypothetical protein [Lichenibacterium sp. 6Y81]